MANFPTLGSQQETNRKILEDLQIKKQLIQKGLNTGLATTAVSPATTQLTDFPQSTTTVTAAPRSAFNPTSSTTLGFFIPQDSYYGNTFIPVLPRLDPLPPNHPPK